MPALSPIILDIPNRTTEKRSRVSPNNTRAFGFWTASEKQIGFSPGIEDACGERRRASPYNGRAV